MRWLCCIALVAFACGENRTPAGGPDAGLANLDCVPDLDRVIESRELPVVLEREVGYLVTENVAVDVAGSIDSGGDRIWGLAGQSAADRDVTFAAAPLGSQWYAPSFPGGQIAVASDAAGTIDAVYRKDENALWLLGLASQQQSPAGGLTLLPYDAPVALFRFPLSDGDRYQEAGTVTAGMLDGLPHSGTDTYEIAVDGTGRIDLPYVSFTQAHRVRIRVVVAPAAGGITTTRRQVSWLFECFGEVARATSAADEPAPDFTNAAELRRFALSRRNQ